MEKLLSCSLFECAVPKPRIYGWSCMACLLICVLLTVSIAMPEKYKEVFVWLIFGVPVLWVLWFCCIYAVDDERWLRKILLLWMLVNLAIIIFIFSFSDFSDWKHSKDGEVVIGTLYLPIVFPLILLPGTLLTSLSNSANSISTLLGAEERTYFIVMWCVLSLLSMLEGCGVFFLSRRFKRRMSS